MESPWKTKPQNHSTGGSAGSAVSPRHRSGRRTNWAEICGLPSLACWNCAAAQHLQVRLGLGFGSFGSCDSDLVLELRSGHLPAEKLKPFVTAPVWGQLPGTDPALKTIGRSLVRLVFYYDTSFLLTSSDANCSYIVAMPIVTSSFLFLVVRPGAPRVASDRSERSDAMRCPLLLVDSCFTRYGGLGPLTHQESRLPTDQSYLLRMYDWTRQWLHQSVGHITIPQRVS